MTMMMEAVLGGGGGGVPEGSHFLLAICFAFGCVSARFLLDIFIFKRLAGILLKFGAAKVLIDDARQSKIVKCSESMWKLTYYVSMQLWVISIIQQEPWSLNTKEYFKGWPNQEMKSQREDIMILVLQNEHVSFIRSDKHPNTDKQETSPTIRHLDLAFSNIGLEAAVDIIQGNGNPQPTKNVYDAYNDLKGHLGQFKLDAVFAVSKYAYVGFKDQLLYFSLKLFYMCQCGFYIYSIAALLTWETRRKDFAIMMSHHVITSILIGYSFLTSFFRIGTIILALHDTSDVFLEAAKVFKYSEKEMGASMGFGLFAISWLILRLIFFPFWIIKSSSYEFIESLMVLDSFPTALYYIFNTMLFTLLIFHIYWWKLICAMIMRQMGNRGKVGEDIRSDSEDGD